MCKGNVQPSLDIHLGKAHRRLSLYAVLQVVPIVTLRHDFSSIATLLE